MCRSHVPVHRLLKNIFDRHKIHLRRGKMMSYVLPTFYMNTLNQNDKSGDPISNAASKFAWWLEVSCWVIGLVSLDDRKKSICLPKRVREKSTTI